MKQDDMVSAAYAQGRRNQRESDEALLRKALESLEWHLERGAYGADIEGVTGNLRAALSQQEEEPQTIDEAMRLPRAMAQAYENGYKAGVAAEREECAKLCEARFMGDMTREDMEARRCAAAIRARGNT